mmetsp:Transcript_49366/g.90719  ORF Transcript_49366/g.90719 Transcript_49366/m.90719 type:complete len:275 (+) Transcript_49366:962-1786(+)
MSQNKSIFSKEATHSVRTGELRDRSSHDIIAGIVLQQSLPHVIISESRILCRYWCIVHPCLVSANVLCAAPVPTAQLGRGILGVSRRSHKTIYQRHTSEGCQGIRLRTAGKPCIRTDKLSHGLFQKRRPHRISSRSRKMWYPLLGNPARSVMVMGVLIFVNLVSGLVCCAGNTSPIWFITTRDVIIYYHLLPFCFAHVIKPHHISSYLHVRTDEKALYGRGKLCKSCDRGNEPAIPYLTLCQILRRDPLPERDRCTLWQATIHTDQAWEPNPLR